MVDAFLQENDRFVFTAAVLEGRDPRVEAAIKEVCKHRNYKLLAVNARSNHVHVVVSAQGKPEPIVDAFKSYATRKLRSEGLISDSLSPWSRGRSRRYLWKEQHVEKAIFYVRYGQGDIEFDIED